MSVGETPRHCAAERRLGRIVDMSVLVRPLTSQGPGWVEGGAVCGDPVRLAAQPDVRAGVGGQVRGASAHSAGGDRLADPAAAQEPAATSPVLDTVRDLADAMLREDLAAPPMQRRTAKPIFERLRAEHDARVSHSYVAKYVRRRRPQLAAESVARDGARSGLVAGFRAAVSPARRRGGGRLL
jgi:hypothetical protein